MKNELTSEDYIITLQDENGEDVNFTFCDLIKHRGKEYVVLLPTEPPEANEVVILQLVSSGKDTEEYLAVGDYTILEAVYKKFKKRAKGRFNFE